MRGAACSRDDDFDTALFGGGGVLEEQVGRAVGGHYFRFMWNTEGGQRVRGVFHGFPVGRGTHDDADERVSRRRFWLCFGSHGDFLTVEARYIVPLLGDKSTAFVFDHRAWT